MIFWPACHDDRCRRILLLDLIRPTASAPQLSLSFLPFDPAWVTIVISGIRYYIWQYGGSFMSPAFARYRLPF
ncbi:MAG: hypothetical protein ACLVJ6_15900 [Merdibacter sp.]